MQEQSLFDYFKFSRESIWEVRGNWESSSCTTYSSSSHHALKRVLYCVIIWLGLLALPFITILINFFWVDLFSRDVDRIVPIVQWHQVGEWHSYAWPVLVYWAFFARWVYLLFGGMYIIDRLHVMLAFVIEALAWTITIIGLLFWALNMIVMIFNFMARISEFFHGD